MYEENNNNRKPWEDPHEDLQGDEQNNSGYNSFYGTPKVQFYRIPTPVDNQGKPIIANLGNWSLILGALSLTFFGLGLNIISGILAIIFGCSQLNKCSRLRGAYRAYAGILTAVLSFVLLVGGWALVSSNRNLDVVGEQIASGEVTSEMITDYILDLYSEEMTDDSTGQIL